MHPRLIAVAATALFLSGCGSHYYNVAGEQSAPVIRKPLASPLSKYPAGRSARILAHAGISSSTPANQPPAALLDLGGDPVPSSKLRRATYSAGLVPASAPTTRTFRIVEKPGSNRVVTDYEISVVKKVSLWERFKFAHNDERTLGRALAWSYANGRKVRPGSQGH